MVRSVNVYSLDDFVVRFGDEALVWNLERFSCPLNVKVEEFLKNKAVHSSRLGASVTYLVVNNETSDCVGYFTLVLKPFKVEAAGLSSSNRRMISRFTELDEGGKAYTAALYLIAQIGKNYALPEEDRISGTELIQKAFTILRAAQKLVGGKMVLVDRELDRPKLLDFYRGNNFRSWNVRHSKKDGMDYDQMICVLKSA